MCKLLYGPGWCSHVLPGQKFKAVGGALIGCLPQDKAHASGQLQLIPSYQSRHGQLKYDIQLVNYHSCKQPWAVKVTCCDMTAQTEVYLDVIHSEVATCCQD